MMCACRIKTETDTEVWGGYFTETGLFHVEGIDVGDKLLNRPEIRMTLDYKEDFQFFSKIFNELYEKGKMFTLKDVINFLDKEPWIININRKVQKLYEEHLLKHTNISYEIPVNERSEACVF